jgi:hypothetical protein
MPVWSKWTLLMLCVVITSVVPACLHRNRTQPTITNFQLPVVAAVRKLDTFTTEKKAEAFREAHPEQVECVYEKAVGYCYWQDRSKRARVLLIQTGQHRYDLLQVKEVCAAYVNKYNGEQDGKPFEFSTVIQTEC